MWLEIRCKSQNCLLAIVYKTEDQSNIWDLLLDSHIRAELLRIKYINITRDLSANALNYIGNN
jgi:hypothetical protein